MMIDVKQAVKNALEYVESILDVTDLINPRLEEVELSPDERMWLITVSFIRNNIMIQKAPSKPILKGFRKKTPSTNSLISAMKQATGNYDLSDREYKLISVNAETGKPVSMKIRQLV